MVAAALARARADGGQSSAAAPAPLKSSAASEAAPAAQQALPADTARMLLPARMRAAAAGTPRAAEAGTGVVGLESCAEEQDMRAQSRRPPPPPLVRQNASRNLLAPHRGHASPKAALARAGSAPAQVPLHALAGVFVRAH